MEPLQKAHLQNREFPGRDLPRHELHGSDRELQVKHAFLLIPRLYKRDVINHVINEVQAMGYAFQMEIVVRGTSNSYGYSLEEVPIVFVDRIFGESKIEGAEITKFLKSVWTLFKTF